MAALSLQPTTPPADPDSGHPTSLLGCTAADPWPSSRFSHPPVIQAAARLPPAAPGAPGSPLLSSRASPFLHRSRTPAAGRPSPGNGSTCRHSRPSPLAAGRPPSGARQPRVRSLGQAPLSMVACASNQCSSPSHSSARPGTSSPADNSSKQQAQQQIRSAAAVQIRAASPSWPSGEFSGSTPDRHRRPTRQPSPAPWLPCRAVQQRGAASQQPQQRLARQRSDFPM